MSWQIGCPQKRNLIDGERCRNCFYKRLPDDVSTVWCRYPTYKKRTENLGRIIKRSYREEEMQKDKIALLYVQGKTRKAEEAERELRELRLRRAALKLRLEANKKMTREAHHINAPLVTAVEDYLSDLTRNSIIAEKILTPNKNLLELYTIIQRESITTPENAIARALKYYNI